MVERIPAQADDEGQRTAIRGDDELVLVFGGLPSEPVHEVYELEQPPLRPEEQAQDVHIVQPGDTLSSIALQRLGSASLADELARLNGLDDPDQIVPGDELRLR